MTDPAFDILGAWSLVSSINYCDDAGTPSFGAPPLGQLQYTADGRMGAFLMNPAWVQAGRTEADSFDEFFAYAGRWQLEGDRMTHFIDFASVPTKVGTRFVRTVVPVSADRMELVTAAETSRSGRVYVTRLTWERVSGEQVPGA